MVRPLLWYGDPILDSAKRKYEPKLDKLHDRALSMIDFNYSDSLGSIYEKKSLAID